VVVRGFCVFLGLPRQQVLRNYARMETEIPSAPAWKQPFLLVVMETEWKASLIFLVAGKNIGIIVSYGGMLRREVDCWEFTRKRHGNCSKISTQSLVPFVWKILTMRRGTKLEKQVLAAITTLPHKAVAQ
jgi:hypothetical protein